MIYCAAHTHIQVFQALAAKKQKCCLKNIRRLAGTMTELLKHRLHYVYVYTAVPKRGGTEKT